MRRRFTEKVEFLKTCKDVDEYFNVIFQSKSDFIYCSSALKTTIDYFQSQFKLDLRYNDAIGFAFINLFKSNLNDSVGCLRTLNRTHPELVYVALPELTLIYKNQFIDLISEHKEQINSTVRKSILKCMVEMVNWNDGRAENLICKFYRSLNRSQIEDLMVKVEGGIQNNKIKVLMSKTPALNYLKYNEQNIKNNKDARNEFLRDVIKNKSILKSINFEVNLSKEDITSLPPCMRFGFLNYFLQEELEMGHYLNYSYNSYYYSGLWTSGVDTKKSLGKDKVHLPLLSKDDLCEILFSISLKKNVRFSKMIEDYSGFLSLNGGMNASSV